MRTFAILATLATLPGAYPLAAQHAPGGSRLHALSVEAAVVAPRTAPATAGFGAGLELGAAPLPGSFRVAVGGWISDTRDGATASGRELSLIWLFRSPALSTAGVRLFAGAGPALAVQRDPARAGGNARPAATATAGLDLSVAPEDAMALELRVAGTAMGGRPARLSLGLGLRVKPAAAALLARGEPALTEPPTEAQPVAPPSNLEQVVGAAGGLLAPDSAGGALQLGRSAFDGSTALTLEAAARLAAAGRTFREIGADRLRVQIYAVPDSTHDIASRRAVAVARALARGGFPAGRIGLEVTPGDGDHGTAGRILAGTRCLSACVSPTTLLR